jgi:hypothetical protein
VSCAAAGVAEDAARAAAIRRIVIGLGMIPRIAECRAQALMGRDGKRL